MIYHAYTDYIPKDRDTLRRNQLAQETWKVQHWTEAPVTDEQLPRLWQEEGRQFAYIKDVFDLACAGKQVNDIIIYTNADIHVRRDCAVSVAVFLSQAGACYAYRRDFGRLDEPLTYDQYVHGKAYVGSDLCGFRVDWWMKCREMMPDMILGLEAWDPCYRHLVDMTNLGKIVSIPDIIGHERHGSYWERSENRMRLKGQIMCRKLARDWLTKYGFKPEMHGL